MAVGTAGVDVDVDRDANRHGRCVDELVVLHQLRVLGCGRGALAAGNFVCGSELGVAIPGDFVQRPQPRSCIPLLMLVLPPQSQLCRRGTQLHGSMA
jgi:hypothetical protein